MNQKLTNVETYAVELNNAYDALHSAEKVAVLGDAAKLCCMQDELRQMLDEAHQTLGSHRVDEINAREASAI